MHVVPNRVRGSISAHGKVGRGSKEVPWSRQSTLSIIQVLQFYSHFPFRCSTSSKSSRINSTFTRTACVKWRSVPTWVSCASRTCFARTPSTSAPPSVPSKSTCICTIIRSRMSHRRRRSKQVGHSVCLIAMLSACLAIRRQSYRLRNSNDR